MRDLTLHERVFIKALQDEGVQFLIVGSWALALHGVLVNPQDLDVLIGTDLANAQAFARAWDCVDPKPGARVAPVTLGPYQQDTIILGPGRGDALTAIGGVDFQEAWKRREMRTARDLHVPVLARVDLIATLQSSERPRDRQRLALLQERP